MDDKKFDNVIKEKIQQDEYIDERVNNLFEMYKEKYRNEKNEENIMKNNIGSFVQKMKYAAAILMVGIVFGTGGMTYAHINGTETWISPLLRSIGINSKYEENAIDINKEVIDENNIKIALDKVAIDESVCIVSYEVEWPNVEVNEWVDVIGDFKVNGIAINPINRFVKIVEANKCICYQVFDFSEINLIENNENIEFISDISLLVEYDENGYDTGSRTYVKEVESNWSFKEIIPVKNIETNVSYEIESNEISFKGYKFKATELVKSSYTNMIRIETNKEDAPNTIIESFIIKDSDGNQIKMNAEIREYDDLIYTNRIFIESLNMDEVLTIEVYAQEPLEEKIGKIGELEIDLSKAKEKEAISTEYIRFSNEDYSFEYDSKWNIYGKLTKDDVGPLVDPTNMFRIETESTTNDAYGLNIIIDVINEDELDNYVKEHIQGFESEYASYEGKEKTIIDGIEGYKLLFKFEGIDIVEYVFEKNGKIYNISIDGDQLEFSNQKENIERFIETFEVK